MKFKIIKQHYDMKPDTIAYSCGDSIADTELYGETYKLVTLVENDWSEGMLRTIPLSKLEFVL
jgi:hypothetical protein